jgi:UDP-glucose:(heptosyl)LPS alpha-1,3-glucosyltransferase
MKLAFCLFEYFPYGGLQRECVRIASACAAAGADVTILTREWQGDRPQDCTVKLFPSKGMTNAKKIKGYVDQVIPYIEHNFFDGVVGFSKMPGLDVYYAADPCFVSRAKKYPFFYRYTQHYKNYAAMEAAVYSPESQTKVLMISPAQKKLFQDEYQLSDDRIIDLPPGVMVDRCAPFDYEAKRKELREQWGIADKHIVLMIGSGFKTKGLDRALKAVAALPEDLKAQTELWIAGQDKAEPYVALIKKLGITEQVHFLGGRDDIPELLWASDCLIHPAYAENTGTVLLESAVAGLPVICTEVCGYAHYIKKAEAGIVLSEPFVQKELNQALLTVLRQPQPWRKNGIQFGLDADIYSAVDHAMHAIMHAIRRPAC